MGGHTGHHLWLCDAERLAVIVTVSLDGEDNTLSAALDGERMD